MKRISFCYRNEYHIPYIITGDVIKETKNRYFIRANNFIYILYKDNNWNTNIKINSKYFDDINR